MSYDPDADMEHGAAQQALLEQIDRALYLAADDKDMSADDLYKEAALCLLQLLRGKPVRSDDWKLDYIRLVLKPIEAFTKEQTERDVLCYRMFLKMATGIGFAINHTYHTKLFRPTTIS